MICLPSHPNYYFCPRNCAIYRLKSGNYEVVSPSVRYKKEITYILYKNGNPEVVRMFDILKSLFPEIEKFLNSKSGKIADLH